jgi:hypothetical protein
MTTVRASRASRRTPALAWFLLLALFAPDALAQWTAVATGIDYAEFAEPGPNRVFVTRMRLDEPTAIVDGMIGQGRLISGRETVSDMVSRYDDTIGYWGNEWGRRYEVVAAINGSYFNLDTGVPDGGMVVGGAYAKRFGELAGGSGMAWTMNRGAFLGRCVAHPGDRQFVTYADGTTQEFDDINTARGGDQLILYTLHYDANTNTDASGIEVDVALETPLLILPRPAAAEGTVVEIRDGAGSTPVFFDHVILSAAGSAAATLRAHVALGDTVGISQELADYVTDCSARTANDWTKTYASVNGWPPILEDGAVTGNATGDPAVHPRTAVALDGTYFYFVVVDGRTTASVGMTLTALATFCRDRLGARWATNQDGGGSSALWVDGTIRNSPSDGSERPVANGYMMVHLLDPTRSATLGADDDVETTAAATLRLGPGTNYPEVATIPAGQAGTVLAHPANGLLARGTSWWYVDFSGTTGWAAEAALRRVGGPRPDGGPDAADGDTGADGDADADADADAPAPDVDSGHDTDGPRPDGSVTVDGDSSGCGCRTSPRASPLTLVGLLAVVGWIVVRRCRGRAG